MVASARLTQRFLDALAPGVLRWIGLRSERRGPILAVDQVRAIEGLGLEGDRRCQGTPGSARQVTLISQEEIGVVAALLRRPEIDPALLRRNLLVAGINLHALRHQRFSIGSVEFEATAYCHPCSRMEEALGRGGFAAMMGHGGLCARIVKGGTLRVGDPVERL